MENKGVSLNKFISNLGICSRREADKLIEQGRVTLNGKRAQRGNRVTPDDEVTVDGEVVGKRKRKKPIYIMFNKPVGVITTTDRRVSQNMIDFIGHEKRIFPVGRLDKDSSGLILLTNDGDIVNLILRKEFKKEKEYIVTVNRPVDKEFVQSMSEGVEILGKKTRKCEVERLGKYVFRIVLTQGLNRQIRRMCKELGYRVKTLHRTRIMHIHLGDLKPGRWRNLNAVEVKKLLE